MPRDPGLRERKKQATREALSTSAVRLATTCGLRAATPEAVAEAVGVSPRTFRNYFGSVEEAITDGFVRRGQALIAALAARPDGEPVWDSLAVVVPAQIMDVAGDPAEVVALSTLFRENRGLLAHQLATFERLDHQLAEVVAARTGADVATELAPHLLAASVMTAVRVSLTLWAGGTHPGPLPDLVRDAIAQLRAGVPQPDQPALDPAGSRPAPGAP